MATPRWKAPHADATVLADPPLAEAPALIRANRACLDASPLLILGRPLAELRRQARREVVATAVDYLHRAGEPIPSFNEAALVVAGHQPELFHPGVWVKNFALNGIARASGGMALNLVVDNDTVKSTALRMPARIVKQQPSVEECGSSVGLATVPFDAWTGEVVYEERPVIDEALFAGFADRVAEVLHTWDYAPLLPAFWAEVRRQSGRTPLLGERLAAARRSLERVWGCHNLEVPLSAVCRTEAFAWFACHLLMNLPHLHATYNNAVHEYRRQNGIRSRNHPVPDLAREGDWWELPLWGWRAGQSRRGRLFARPSSGSVELRIGTDNWPALPLAGSPNGGIAAWRELGPRGFKVRSRALTTTLFARLFLGDLFIHGIGGGKYDALTDELMRGFYGCEPPRFAVLSATLHLPLRAFPARPERHRQLARLLRDLRYNPQRQLADSRASDTGVAALLAQQRDWIQRAPTNPAEKRERFHTLRGILDKLQPLLAAQDSQTRQKLACLDRQLRANAVLQRRDYAFCLFSEEKLRPFCTQFL